MGAGTLSGDFSEALASMVKAWFLKKFHIQGTPMCHLSLCPFCPSSKLLWSHSSLLKDTDKPKPYAFISSLSSEPFPLFSFTLGWPSGPCHSPHFTYLWTIHNNVFYTILLSQIGNAPSRPPFLCRPVNPLLRYANLSAWPAAPGGKKSSLEAFVT